MTEQSGRHLPKHVLKECERYLDCSVLSRGFARVRCTGCGHDRFVAFSCKTRSWCPSCGGRHMNETAAHLVDNVIGKVPVRHWTCTLPPPMRYLLAYDSSLCSAVLDAFIRAVFGWLKRKAKTELGLKSVRHAHPAAITAVHRASSHLALNIHFHTIAADGIYVQESLDEPPVFRALPAPTRAEVMAVAWETCTRALRALRKRGLWIDVDPSEDRFAQQEPGLAQCCAASLQGVLLLGPRAGQRLIRVRGEAAGDAKEFKAQGQVPGYGFSVHAKRRVSAHDRKGLERLARYVSRPVVAQDRLKLLPNGKVLLELKRRWSDGTSHFVFDALDFLSKLAALVPPPRTHRTRYHGAWARRSKLRRLVTPTPKTEESCDHSGAASCRPVGKPGRHRYEWAKLLARVFSIDVLKCSKCKTGRMQRIAWITNPPVIHAMLASVGLPADSPEPAPSRLPEQMDWTDAA
jgi:hypothetical protein